MRISLLFAVAILFAASTATAQVSDTTRNPATPSHITVTYGESPIASGLTVDANWDHLNMSASFNENGAFAMWFPFVGSKNGWTILAGGATGFQSQVPFVGPLGILIAPTKTELALWPGFSAGRTRSGFSAHPDSLQILWLYAEVKQPLPGNLTVSVATLQYEGSEWNILPAILWAPEIQKGLQIRTQVTLDRNAEWNLLFALGIRVKIE